MKEKCLALQGLRMKQMEYTKNNSTFAQKSRVPIKNINLEDICHSVILLSAMGRFVVVRAMLLLRGRAPFFLSCPLPAFSVLPVLVFLGLLHSFLSFVRLFLRSHLHHDRSLGGGENGVLLQQRGEKDTEKHQTSLKCMAQSEGNQYRKEGRDTKEWLPPKGVTLYVRIFL